MEIWKKMWVGVFFLNTVYFRDFTLYIRPSRPHYELLILFDFRATSVNSFNRKRRHIGIRIIYYPINGYPDSKLSVLSIPNSM